MGKEHANRGLPRNKKPLSNIIYSVRLVKELKTDDVSGYQKYMFKDEGYMVLEYRYESSGMTFLHGFIEVDRLKKLLGEKQYSKFCQGKREFIIQRRVEGRNVPIV